MSGHSKFAKIKHKKAAQDDKRSRTFCKAVKDIQVAVVLGGSDPTFNNRLKMAMMAAKAVNLPKSKIDDAIKKVTSKQELANLKEYLFEGYIESVAVLVEGITDKISRAQMTIKKAFNKSGGSMSPEGTVKHHFQNLGFITYPGSVKSEDEMLDLALEAGADDCTLVDNEYEILSQFDHLHKVRDNLEKTLGEATNARLIWKPNHLVTLDSDDRITKVLRLVDTLEDHEDVRDVWTNLDIPDGFDYDSS